MDLWLLWQCNHCMWLHIHACKGWTEGTACARKYNQLAIHFVLKYHNAALLMCSPVLGKNDIPSATLHLTHTPQR